NGGAGADAIDQTGPISNGSGGGIGGAGGNGLVLTGTNSSSNSTMGVISGGNGGDGGNGGAGGGVATVGGKGGKGGAGGIGLLTSSGATFTNEGTITGGSGGAASIGGAGSTTQSPPVLADGGLAGVGGVGVSGSDLTLINDGSITGGLDGDGVIRANAITFTGGANTLELWAGSTILGNVVGTGSDTLALGGASDGSFDISAVDAGEQYQGFSALQKNGTSDWTVTGTQTTTAAWLVNAGTLSVNGDISSASSVAVNSGGTLGGTGTIGTTTIDSGGALAPGNSIGTLTVVGDLTFNSGANYNVEVSPSTADRTNATGTAALAGAVNATYAAGSYTVRQYTILNAASGITGTFDALNNVSLPSTLAATLSYDNNNVYLDLRLHFPAPGGTLSVNQQNVADTLNNYFYTNGGIQTPFTLLDANGLSQASGETGGSLEQSVLTGAGSFMGSVFDNAFGAFGASGNTTGQGGQALGLAEPVRIASTSDDAFGFSAPHEQMQRWSAWAIGYGGYARVSGDSGAGTHDTTSRVYGVSAGATFHASPDLSLGIALGGASSDFGVAQGFGSGEADAFNVALYGRQAIGAGYVAAALGYTAQDATTDRTVSAGGATDVLHASFHPQALTTRLETGWRFTTGSFGITPYAAIQTATLFLPSYGETATSGPGIFALSYDRHSFTATRGEIGPRFDKTILLGDQALTLKAKTAWAHDWNNDPVTTATFQQLPGTSFTVSGAKPAVDSALLSLDADLALGRGWSVNIGFDGEFSHTTESYVGRGNLRYEW
ncbi:MAG TPA: autotransporter domain-containing protein, partial [Parvibaculum sp.]